MTRITRFGRAGLLLAVAGLAGLKPVYGPQVFAQTTASVVQAQAPLTEEEQKVVGYVLEQIGKSKAGKPNFGPETAAAVKKDLGITVAPPMVPRIRAAVVEELKRLEARLTLKEGSKAPDFSLPTLNGGTVKLSDLKGKVVVVNFWATWCPPCLQEMPVLNELSVAYKDKAVVLGLSLDEEGLPITEAFVKKLGVTYPIVESDKKTYQAYGNVLTIPHTFVIDKNGVVKNRFVGNQDKTDFEAALKAAM
ncbi:MAG: TlpA family protein disulfide reductase [candidate division Zixibacteria bacterium]|nr:TlpA family protein disulfide reductase [candidate division Zixibacteria bacterium]